MATALIPWQWKTSARTFKTCICCAAQRGFHAGSMLARRLFSLRGRPVGRSALPVLSASVPGGRGKPLDDSASAPTHVAGKRFKDKSRTGPFPAARHGQSANALPGVIRIIGGQWRRRKLPVAQGPGVPAGLRPTPDRVRETLFNWLGQDLGGWRCVDVCAGTGALGLRRLPGRLGCA